MLRRTSGSPPVMRIFRTPFSMKAAQSRSSSSSVRRSCFGRKCHVLGHAVDAAEVAAVGDGDAQIGDRAAERVDHARPRHRCEIRQFLLTLPPLRIGLSSYMARRRAPRQGSPARRPDRAITRLVFLALEGQVPHALRRIGDLPDVAPGLLVVRDDELVHARRDDVALHAGRVGEEHEGLLPLRGRRRIDRRLGRAVVVVDLDEIAFLQRRAPSMSAGFISMKG